MIYSYWLIRFVPNVARGEFTNIGIVAGADGHDWCARFDIRGGSQSAEPRRWARWFSGRIDEYSAQPFGADTIGSGWVEHLRSRQASSVQFSEASMIDAPTARAAVDLLFPHLVERDRAKRARRTLTRTTMRAELRDTFEHDLEFTPGVDLFVRPQVSIGKSRGRFDLGRTDKGESVLTNAWAFNLTSLETLERELQSWNYLVSRLRKSGADADFAGSQRVISANAPIEVVYDAPASDRPEKQARQDIFEAALEAWSIERIHAAPIDTYLSDLRTLPMQVGATGHVY